MHKVSDTEFKAITLKKLTETPLLKTPLTLVRGNEDTKVILARKIPPCC